MRRRFAAQNKDNLRLRILKENGYRFVSKRRMWVGPETAMKTNNFVDGVDDPGNWEEYNPRLEHPCYDPSWEEEQDLYFDPSKEPACEPNEEEEDDYYMDTILYYDTPRPYGRPEKTKQ